MVGGVWLGDSGATCCAYVGVARVVHLESR